MADAPYPYRGATPRDILLKDYIDATVGGAGAIIYGHGAPGSGPQVDPFDGINDPWRWSDGWAGWISPAFEVTWEEGAVLPAPETEGDPNLLHVAIFDGPGITPSIYEAIGNAGEVAETAGSGVGMVVQFEENFTHTAVPNINQPYDQSMFGDFLLGEPHEFPDVSTGEDGQFYIDLDTRDLYGPRINGEWTHFSTLPAPS